MIPDDHLLVRIHEAKELEFSFIYEITKTSIHLGIWSTTTFIGAISLNKIDWDIKKADIGYWLDQDMQGKGIITNCCKKLLYIGFKEFEFREIFIKCDNTNLKSIKVAEKLKFNYYNTENEETNDNSIIYSITQSQWELEYLGKQE